MSPLVLVLVAATGAVGALVRAETTAALARRGMPRAGTGLVNIVGAIGLGLVIGADAGADVVRILGLGLFGGLTTFSTWVVDLVAPEGGVQWRSVPLHIIGVLLAGVGGALVARLVTGP